MRRFIVVSILLSLMMTPNVSFADSITLKNGRIIDATKCWEDGDLIKCKQYGATVGYQKSDIKQVVPKPEKKKIVRQNKSKSIDMYRLEVAFKIQKSWTFDSGLSNGRDNEMVAITFSVLPDGSLKDIVVAEMSGDPYLDESAMKAIIKASPVPPHPPGINQPEVKMGIRFTPNGIR